MNSTLVRRGWFVGVLVATLVGWGALAALAGSGHVGSHPGIASSSAATSAREEPPEAVDVEHLATTPQAIPEQENEAAENEAAENEDNDENEDEDEAAPPAGAPTSSRTFTLIGGTVSVTCTGNVISLGSATPNAGFTVETEKEDGQQIEVTFRSDTHESKLEVGCRNGQVVVEEIREEAD